MTPMKILLIVYFGALNSSYEEYLKHNDDMKRLRYLKRAMKIKGNWYKNPYNPNSLQSIFKYRSKYIRMTRQ